MDRSSALDLSVEVLGEQKSGAAPLVIAHGLLGSGRNWMTLGKRLAEHRQVALVDLRNHGASPWSDAMSYPLMAEDLIEAAWSAFGAPAVLLGHSMGGKAAMAAALTRPERVRGVIVADMAPVAYQHSEHVRFVEAMRGADLSRAAKRSDVEPQLKHAAPDLSLRAFLMQNLAFEEQDGVKRARWRPNLASLSRNMADIVGWPAQLSDRRYDGPAFFYHGGASPYVTADGRAAIARSFSKAEIETMAGAGHWLHAERPDLFFDRTAAWLAARGL